MALDKVKAAGNATGMAASRAVTASGTTSPTGSFSHSAMPTWTARATRLNIARLRTTRITAFCCEPTTLAVRTNSAVRPNLVRGPVASTSATASPRRTSAPA